MRFTSCDPRSRSANSAALLAVVILLTARAANAGESLTIEQLAERTHGAAVVKVHLGRGKGPRAVELVRVIRGLPDDISPASWLGLCLPRKQVLQSWTIEYRKWPPLALWRRALARGHYEAVVLVEKVDGGYRPRCGVEAMEMRHTDLSDGYVDYEKRVDAELQRRAQTGPPR